MDNKCPVDYDINSCSSKEYGLTCETCFHSKDIKLKELSVDDLIESIRQIKSVTRK